MKASEWPSAWPLPCTRVLTVSLGPAFSAGMVTAGALPKLPDTVTDGVAEEFEEVPPHPASATAASRGRADMTAIRRMGSKPCRRRLRKSSAEAPPAYRLSGPDGPGPVPGQARPATTAAPTVQPPAGRLRRGPLPAGGEFTSRR